MNPLMLITIVAVGASADSYGSSTPVAPAAIKYESGTLYSPVSYFRTSPPSRYPIPPSYYQPTRPVTYSYPGTLSYNTPVVPSRYPGFPSSFGYGRGSSDKNAAISSFTRDIQPGNSDTTSFTTSNGIRSSHNVHVIRGNPGSYRNEYGNTVQSDSTITMNGHSYHQSPEGMHVSLNWNADENGFSAEGDHLPKPVPMPTEHAEAHRQALQTAAQSPDYRTPSGSYGGTSSTGGGYSTGSQMNYSQFMPMAGVSIPSYSAPPSASAWRPVWRRNHRIYY